MITIGFCNLKGGVGKTTACQNIAVAVAKTGRKVAAIDMDPQSNLSAGFGLKLSPEDPQVFDLLSGGASWDDIVQSKEGIDIIPSSLNLAMAELNEEGPVSHNNALRNALMKIDPNRYDYVFIDSPPQLGAFTRNVLSASNKIIVPMDGGYYSLFGLKLLDKAMPVLRKRLNPELEIAGILMTNYSPRLYISHQIYEGVRKSFGAMLLENYIRQNISLVEASSTGTSIFAYAPKSTGAKCYKDAANEILDRFEGRVAVPKPESQEQEPEQEPKDLPQQAEPEPIEESVAVEMPAQEEPTQPAGEYEEGIKREILAMLPESERGLWQHMLGSISDISRHELEVKSLREDFNESDRSRYTFYILSDEDNTFGPVNYPDQITQDVRCVIKWDENGSAEVYM